MIKLFLKKVYMIHFTSYILGTITGVYLAQNYDLPDVKNIGDKIDCIPKFNRKKNNKKKYLFYIYIYILFWGSKYVIPTI